MLGDIEHFEHHRDLGYCRCFMREGRETEPNEIFAELWESSCKMGLEWLIGVFNVIFKTIKVPEE